MENEIIDFEKERKEAVTAGYEALNALNSAKDRLSSARGWGIFDTFFGGGFISSAIKHSNMSEAKELINQAQYKLQRFNKELGDLQLSGIKLETFDLVGIGDLFFDGFLWDIISQGRIADAREKVENAISQVERIVRNLEKLR